jgi:hypothetical protein
VSRAMQAELASLRTEYSARDRRMWKIATARMPGGLALVFPDLFPNEADSPYRDPMVANMVDIAARDTSEVLAPPPAFNCASALDATDKARKFADRRTKIAYGYFDASRLGVGLLSMADQYVTYGFAVGVVKPDLDRKTPVLQFMDPMGCYPLYDTWGRTKVLYEVRKLSHLQAEAKFPELAARLKREYRFNTQNGRIEIVRRYSADDEVLFCPEYPDMILGQTENPLSRPRVHVFRRPGLNDEAVGQFDDVLAVQVAKARFALLTLEAAQKSVQAPLALPMDVQEVNVGPDSTLKSLTPQQIKRVALDVPPQAFAQQSLLDDELRRGARYPKARTGNTDASVVTGRGVQALMSGFDTQIKTGQAVFAEGLQTMMSVAFEMDEKVWPNTEKTVNGNMNGTPYSLKYKPSRDLNGDWTIDVSYGLMAGLAPNQALVFGLQARGDKLISRDFLRRQMPFSLDAAQEESKVDVEDLRESLKMAYEATAQAIPAMTQQGGSPAELLRQMAMVIETRQKGKPIEEAIAGAFQQPEPPEPAEAPGMEEPGAMPGLGEMGGGPAGPPMGAPEQQGRPDIMQLMASLGRTGPALNASVQRRVPIG